MFTGIIRQVGQVVSTRATGAGRRLTIDLGPLGEGLHAGDSVAVAGACLTVAEITGSAAGFDVAPETLSRTTLARLRAGSKVNVERPLRLGDAIDGHLVQGHVDGMATVKSIRRGDQWLVEFAAPKELADQMVPKGSVAIDGVSLTLVEASGGVFSVALIPTTLARTTLADLRGGDGVNVETDIIGKYVRRTLAQGAAPQPAEGLTVEKLRQAGYL